MEENRRITIKDIAEELGLSTATVSNVIHGKTKKISDRTVFKVQEKLQESGYIPNMAAVLLAQNSSKIVCVVLADHEKYEGKMIEDPFVAGMLNVISKELAAYGYFMMIKEEKDIDKVVAYASMWNMAGLILMGYCAVDYEMLRAKMHIPFVVVDSYEKSVKSYVDIGVDNIEGGYLAGKYLTDKGHKHILYFADNKEDCDLDRYTGLVKALEDKNKEKEDIKGTSFDQWQIKDKNVVGLKAYDSVFELVSFDKESRESDYERVLQTISDNAITAVFAASDFYAIEFMRFLLKRGIKVPEEISIMGFDDIPLASLVYPSLSTISQNIPIRAKKAVEMLHEQIQFPGSVGSLLLPVELVERNSVADVL